MNELRENHPNAQPGGYPALWCAAHNMLVFYGPDCPT